MRLMRFNYCRSFYVKLLFFTIFVLTLQTDFTASCFGFNENDSTIEEVRQPVI